MASLLAAPYSAFYDSNGAPLNGGLVYTYSAGTTTPKATYSDSTGATPLANPVVLDSAGRTTIWLSGAYKIVVKDSLGNTLETTDNVIGSSTSSSAPWAVAAGTADVITATYNPAVTSLTDGLQLAFRASGANTTSTPTFSPNGITAHTITKQGGTALGIGDISGNLAECIITYNLANTRWELLNPSSGASGIVNDFRLTLTTVTPVTNTDVTGATTIYCTPYKGKRISLYDGSANWNTFISAEFSLALGTLTSGKPYDVFCYNSSGTPTLEFLVWTSDTARATALVYQDGILVKSGATTRRYLGTFYTTATTTTEDSLTKRYLFNYYNRVVRPMLRVESTSTWNYTTLTWRQANGSASNQLNYIAGVAEDSVYATAIGVASGTATAGTAVGVDSTSTPSGAWGVATTGANGNAIPGSYHGIPGVGRHFLAWLEISQATGTTAWSGTATINGVTPQSGIHGQVLA